MCLSSVSFIQNCRSGSIKIDLYPFIFKSEAHILYRFNLSINYWLCCIGKACCCSCFWSTVFNFGAISLLKSFMEVLVSFPSRTWHQRAERTDTGLIYYSIAVLDCPANWTDLNLTENLRFDHVKRKSS